MKSVSGLMTEYFQGHSRPVLREFAEVPISPNKSEWDVLQDPERMSRTYEFKGRSDSMVFFVQELVEFQERLGHHAKITIEKDQVSVEIYTHGIQRVTDIDKEYAEEADKIYRDASEF